MNGLSLHFYTTEANKYPATGFGEQEYKAVIEKAYKMEELVTRHGEIMNHYDPQKRVGMIVDEWGTWYRAEPGTNPWFLYQQNTIRDAVVAGLTLNIFNKHCDRVKMANIAQIVNVLQALVLTDGEKMLLTPTYHVFKMYKEHQQNTLLGSFITSPKFAEGYSAPQLVESASMQDDGTIISTIVNTSADLPAEIECQIADFKVKQITAEILTGDMGDYNTFEQTKVPGATTFTDFKETADGFKAVLPPCSIVKFVIR